MITYTFTTTKNPTLQQVVQTIENAFPNLKIDTFTPNPYPSSNTQLRVHGYVVITQAQQTTTITVAFFESPTEWDGYAITQNNVTIDYISDVYPSIPTQTQLQTVLSGAGLI